MISVMMPLYNAEKYVAEAIDSVLGQTYGDFELIIVNDGSQDRSGEIAKSYTDPRIRYIEQPNGGEAAARNTALSHAKGEFVTFQDSDDISVPNRLETLLKHFYSDKIGIVHSDMILIDEAGAPIGYWQSRNIKRERVLRFLLKIGTPFNNPSMMVRMQAIQGQNYDLQIKVGTDTDMVSRLATQWESVHVPEPLLQYRRHGSNLSQNNDYETLFLHVRKFIEGYALQELVPEVDWSNPGAEPRARAKAIIGLLLWRRDFVRDAQAWLAKAALEAREEDNRHFVNAMGALAMTDYTRARVWLLSIRNRDAVIDNYLGETYARLGNPLAAKQHFLSALSRNPAYEEPMDYLRALGGSKSYHLVDTSWQRLLRP
jgi:glycosyltransferase involved in cell wall biosynthesis